MKKINLLYLALSVGLCACVSKKQYNELLSAEQQQQQETEKAKQELADKQVTIHELNAENDRLKQNVEQLVADTLRYSKKVYALQNDVAHLNDQNTELNSKLKKSTSNEEVKLLLGDVQKLQNELQTKENDLKKTETLLAQTQTSLDKKQKEIENQQVTINEQKKNLEEQQKQIDEQNHHLTELQAGINKKDSLMKALKNKISQALIGFEGDGLSVRHENGKVYVSLEEKLLFQTAKWDVDPKGEAALEKLSKVLAENPNIRIITEGHTDDVPYSGQGQVIDNWDLSVRRATAITRIILKNKDIDPKRISASGRSEFLPLDDSKTPEARRKNRRTEIILSPNLDEVINLLGNEDANETQE